MMTKYNDGISEGFKKKVEALKEKLEPKDKESNELWQQVSELCKEDVKDTDK